MGLIGLLSIMTLNLHTWQETEAREKLDRVADYIAENRFEVVALQEVGQHVDGVGAAFPFAPFQGEEDTLFPDDLAYPDEPGNSALYLVQRLRNHHKLDYQMVWIWAHIGFGSYQEGSALLSLYPITGTGQATVSSETDRNSPSTRRILWADIESPQRGPFRVVSAHLGWGGDQVSQVQKTLDTLKALPPRPTLLAGDFNLEPTAEGYRVLTNAGWKDQALAALQRGRSLSTMGSRRIDYVWAFPPQAWQPQESLTHFHPRQSGASAPVSDHAAVIIRY